MFNDNLKMLRTAKGYTQEELAIKLNVVRQTVSKWEKGLSVPDVEMLSKIADILETKVSVLLGGMIEEEVEPNAVAEQLAKISEQLAIRNRRSKTIWKVIGIILLVIVVFSLVSTILGYVLFGAVKSSTIQSDDGIQQKIELDVTDDDAE